GRGRAGRRAGRERRQEARDPTVRCGRRRRGESVPVGGDRRRDLDQSARSFEFLRGRGGGSNLADIQQGGGAPGLPIFIANNYATRSAGARRDPGVNEEDL